MYSVRGYVMRGLGFVIATILAGCTVVPRETRLTVMPGASRPVVAQIGNYQDAVDAIVSVMTEDLQMPVPRTSFTLYFYPYREAFAQGLTERFNTDPTRARAIAKSALGRIRQTKEGKQFLVNEEILDNLRWPERIHVFAHELTHIVQYELADGRLTGDLWLIEGFADWVAYQVLEALGLDTFSRRKHLKIDQVKHEREHPLLSQMVTVQDWEALNASYGSAIPYAQAFLATDLLIEQRGLSAVIDYFRRVPLATDLMQNFQAAFGTELATFQHEFTAYLESLLGWSQPNAAPLTLFPNRPPTTLRNNRYVRPSQGVSSLGLTLGSTSIPKLMADAAPTQPWQLPGSQAG
jgi:hypothetical protein